MSPKKNQESFQIRTSITSDYENDKVSIKKAEMELLLDFLTDAILSMTYSITVQTKPAVIGHINDDRSTPLTASLIYQCGYTRQPLESAAYGPDVVDLDNNDV